GRGAVRGARRPRGGGLRPARRGPGARTGPGLPGMNRALAGAIAIAALAVAGASAAQSLRWPDLRDRPRGAGDDAPARRIAPRTGMTAGDGGAAAAAPRCARASG